MLKHKTIAVVIPAWNVADHIRKVLETLPPIVDRAYVIDDVSTDQTASIVASTKDGIRRSVELIQHHKNGGVGAAIVSGYQAALRGGFDICAVMAGDGQMDPAELASICLPVASQEADYVKGNRLMHADAWSVMPKHRFFGNAILSLLTKLASGYWKLADFQTGYTAISAEMLKYLPLDRLYPRYGFPNDILVKLNVMNARVKEITIRPVYEGAKSHLKVWKVVPTISLILIKGFWWRLKQKYIIRDFHPLVFFYIFGFLSITFGALFGLYLIIIRIFVEPVTATSALFAVVFFLSGFQSLFFAMWMDMESNRDLQA